MAVHEHMREWRYFARGCFRTGVLLMLASIVIMQVQMMDQPPQDGIVVGLYVALGIMLTAVVVDLVFPFYYQLKDYLAESQPEGI